MSGEGDSFCLLLGPVELLAGDRLRLSMIVGGPLLSVPRSCEGVSSSYKSLDCFGLKKSRILRLKRDICALRRRWTWLAGDERIAWSNASRDHVYSATITKISTS